MNGRNKEDIVTTSLKSPTGLTIDYTIDKLFWLDSKMRQIESSDLDGKHRRRIVVYDIKHPFDIAVFGDYIYWSDSWLKTVSSANKFTGKNKTLLISNENVTSFVPKGMSIQHSLSQPQGNFSIFIFYRISITFNFSSKGRTCSARTYDRWYASSCLS